MLILDAFDIYLDLLSNFKSCRFATSKINCSRPADIFIYKTDCLNVVETQVLSNHETRILRGHVISTWWDFLVPSSALSKPTTGSPVGNHHQYI